MGAIILGISLAKRSSLMKTTCWVLVALGLVAAPAWADRKVDEARAKADEQLQKGKPDEAEKTLRKLADQMPTSPEAHAALTQLLMQLNKVDEAATSAQKAVEVSSAAPAEAKAQALATMAALDLMRGSSKDAVKNANQAVQLAPTPANLAVLTRAQVRARENTAALQTAEKAVQGGASAAASHEALGEAQLAAGKAVEAAASFRKALELDPKLSVARVGLAQSLMAQGKATEAIAEAKKATEMDPNSGAAFAAHGMAILADNRNNAAAALNEAGQAAYLAPRNADVQVMVGRIFEQSGNLDQAVAAFKRALEADPDYVPARVSLVMGQILRGKPDEALPEAKKLHEQYPNNGEAAAMYGRLLLQKKDYANAVPVLLKASEGMPGSAEVNAFLGTAQQFTGDSAGALEAYRKAVALAPTNVSYRSTFGLLLAINDKYDEAIKELTQVVNSPGYKDTAGWTNMGYAYRNMEPTAKPEEALKAYAKALELDPKNAQAAIGLGWSYIATRKYDEGIANFEKARTLDAQTAGEAYNGTAWCYYFKNDLMKAKETAAKAKEAGRNVSGLLSNIDKKEKGAAVAQEEAAKALASEQRAKAEPGIGDFSGQLQRGGPAARRQAATNMAQLGAPAVPFLQFSALNDKDLGVRTAAVQSLGRIGAPARSSCPYLKQLADTNPYEKTVMEKAEMEAFVEYEDFRKVVRATMRSICQ
jgi:tetratricopeptide (TPR) repeat protein